MYQISQKPYAQGYQMETHQRTHTGENSEINNLVSSTKGNMISHKGDKLYRYQICPKSFDQDMNLWEHLRTHTGEESHSSQHCRRSFTDVSALKQHMMDNVGEKTFKCTFCRKSFSETGHLRDHLNTHTGEKPYSCQLCSKSFIRNSHLKNHMRTHTGEKPFKCQLCKKSFNQDRNLKRHMRTHGSLALQCILHQGTLPQDLKIGSYVIANLSDQFTTFSSSDVTHSPNELFLKKIYLVSNGLTGTLPIIRNGDHMLISKFKSTVDATPSFSKSFGCGICDELLDTEKEFLEHCSGHQLSPPDDLFADLRRIMIPQNQIMK